MHLVDYLMLTTTVCYRWENGRPQHLNNLFKLVAEVWCERLLGSRGHLFPDLVLQKTKRWIRAATGPLCQSISQKHTCAARNNTGQHWEHHGRRAVSTEGEIVTQLQELDKYRACWSCSCPRQTYKVTRKETPYVGVFEAVRITHWLPFPIPAWPPVQFLSCAISPSLWAMTSSIHGSGNP
jgi:hypothetical protein